MRALLVVSALAGCATGAGRPTPPPMAASPASQSLAQRFFAGPDLGVAAKRAAAVPEAKRMAASVAYAMEALEALVAPGPLAQHATVFALQSAPDRESALRLFSAGHRARTLSLSRTLRLWERCRGGAVGEASDEQSQTLYPVHFPLQPQGEILAAIRRVRRRLSQASHYVGACQGAKLVIAVDEGAQKIIALQTLRGVSTSPPPSTHGTTTLRVSATQEDTVALVAGVQRWLPAEFAKQRAGAVEIKVSAPGYHQVSFWRSLPRAGRVYRSHFMLVSR